ncbi:MAG: phosphoenolpyruvate--protein phosphotransferase [Gemmatimonadales bacterium]|nr:phosphoenolpyruvate--protein phosphotransferase [Gemmatimonadales bacterium]NIN12815.1 phosphoenolpyruvate--protein phosphotransferase [Gemmatimonadales bacterium]NIN48743.1 phosphoenolpyruvate--protein phosphotransferase [Gemmatimonadales bacterium]NIP06207.1 phosphoenolpyruvate--protein phosphotransferase [Gemmatimonadales bacterium]NIR01392.1 phosphoenolpyruvate--protein phosphotransferase [Gemmatimonadales bacterium]
MTGRRVLRGLGVSQGIAIGPASVIVWDLPTVTRRVVAVELVETEVQRLQDAVAAVRTLLEDLRERTRQRAGREEAKIFDAQILMLEDPDFLGEVETLIRENQLSAERAFEFKTLEMRALWSQSPSFQLRQRVADLTGIQVPVLNHLVGKSLQAALKDVAARPAIVFTRELTPGLTVQLEREQVAGFASLEGTRTAHAAILARSLRIPCVMGLIGGFEEVRDGTEVILDGTHGVVLLDPTAEQLAEARAAEGLRQELAREMDKVVSEPAVTADGVALALRGNVDLPEELDSTAEHGAEGVGLLRTEFLILGRTKLPGEDEQAAFFERVAKRFPAHPVIIRSYDLGGDKYPAPFQSAPEANPFLGWRAIRVCLDQPEIFRTQIRALLRARRHGDVQLMLPLVTQVEEVEQARELVAETARELRREGVPAAQDLPVGVMIETPAAAVLADELAQRSDFMSIGTNDLTQYTLAVDRGNARLARRFTPHHPAVVNLLKQIVEAGERAGVETSVCGEMASDPISAFLLLGLGFRVLSVAPPTLPLVRWLVRQVEVRGAERAAEGALQAATTSEATEVIEEAISHYVDLELLHAGRLPGVNSAATLKSP